MRCKAKSSCFSWHFRFVGNWHPVGSTQTKGLMGCFRWFAIWIARNNSEQAGNTGFRVEGRTRAFFLSVGFKSSKHLRPVTTHLPQCKEDLSLRLSLIQLRFMVNHGEGRGSTLTSLEGAVESLSFQQP